MYRTIKLTLSVFAITLALSACGKKTEQPASESTTTTTTTTTTGSSAEVDGFLKEYEGLMDEYVTVIKKAKTDPAATQELAPLQERAMAMTQKITAMESKMTPADIEKFKQITEKMTVAMQEAQK